MLCPICSYELVSAGTVLGEYAIYKCLQCSHRCAPEAFNVSVNYNDVHETEEYKNCQEAELKSLLKKPKCFAKHPTYLPFFKRIQKNHRNKLLDVGCGVGRFCHAAFAHGWDVSGIDVSQRAIDTGKKYASFPLSVNILEEKVNKKERYEVVTAFEVLEHCSDPIRFLMLAKQVIQPGGQLFCTVPNWDCSEVRNSNRRDWIPPIHIQFFTKRSLFQAGRQAGLRNVKVGIIHTDPVQGDFLNKLKWLKRRVFFRPNSALGLWMHAWN